MQFGDGGGSGDRMPGIVFVVRVAGAAVEHVGLL